MFEQELSDLRARHLFRRPLVIDSVNGSRITVGGRSLLLFCSNDYLGLSQHPALLRAAMDALERFGFGAGASRLVSGTSALHQELETKLAEFKGCEASLLFNSGYAANTGIIPSLVNEGDVVYSDSLNHASIVDGCRSSKALVSIYRHRDMNHLEDLLQKTGKVRRRLIVTDGVFSMDGDIAPLPDIVSLSERYGSLVMVDDAHATGVLGKTGRGTVEHFGLHGRVHIQMGTLGKALGSFGAYAAGASDMIEYLVNRARSYIYSTALPPSVCAASIAALDVVRREPDLLKRLWRNRERFVSGLHAAGLAPGPSASPIVPIMTGGVEQTVKVADELFEQGIYASAIRPPTVPEGTSRIRMTISAIHSEKDIDRSLEVVGALRRKGLLG